MNSEEKAVELRERILKLLRSAIEYVEKDQPVMADEIIMDAKRLTGEWFWELKNRDKSTPHTFKIVMPGSDKPIEAK